MQSGKSYCCFNLCVWTFNKLFLSPEIFGGGAMHLGYNIGTYKKPLLGGNFMKVVVVKSPKFLGAIMRLFFGIKKQSD